MVGLVGLVIVVDLVAMVPNVDRTLRAVRVGGGERGANVLKTDPVFGKRLRVEFGAHRRQCAAAHRHLADAVYLREFLRQYRGRGVVEVALLHRIRGQCQHQNWSVGRIDFPVCRIRAQARRQIRAGGIDGRLHVTCGSVDVAIEAKLKVDARRPDRARRGDLSDIGDLAKMALERGGDAGSNHLRACAGQLRAHRDGREVGQQRGRDGALDEQR